MNLSIDFLFAALVAVVLIVVLLLYASVYLKPPEVKAIQSSLILSRLVLDPLFNKYVKDMVVSYLDYGRVPRDLVYHIESLVNSYVGPRRYCMVVYLHSCATLVNPYTEMTYRTYDVNICQIPRESCRKIIGVASQEGMVVAFYDELRGTYEICNLTVLLKVS